jgi:glycerol transport system ATP-binding protein
VRPDVSAVLFDEPLTVIDPHLKWQLRRKLKQIHHELKLTLIYVTHDQVEALTFAEEVVVMTRGRAVQTGSADALFERPRHTFVGHFIGSPGMNFLPATVTAARCASRTGRWRCRPGAPCPTETSSWVCAPNTW